MLKFYFNTAPNPNKVALFLEESGLQYEPVPVDTRKGEQHKPEFLAINPNAKLPAIVDGDVTVFDSKAGLVWKDSAGREHSMSMKELADWRGNRADAGRLAHGLPKSNKFGKAME